MCVHRAEELLGEPLPQLSMWTDWRKAKDGAHAYEAENVVPHHGSERR